MIEVFSLVAFRFSLGIGLYIEHEENKLIADNDSANGYSSFEGLIIRLPFVEILIGELYVPTLPPKEEATQDSAVK